MLSTWNRSNLQTGWSAIYEALPRGHAQKVPWPHAPLHRLSDSGTYFLILTVGTYQRQHHFRGADRLAVLHRVCSP
jgi:hypothetical protein